MLKNALIMAVVGIGSSAPVYAQEALSFWRPRPRPVPVPEIDASSGLLAVAAVATVLLFVWERNRRAKT
jgi:hypothetical protein